MWPQVLKRLRNPELHHQQRYSEVLQYEFILLQRSKMLIAYETSKFLAYSFVNTYYNFTHYIE